MKIFHLPDLGEGLAEAEIREWYVKEGDDVTVDQPLVSMETAKAVVDVPSPYAGKIIKLFGNTNDIIQTGAPFISFETAEKHSDQGSVVGKLESSESKWNEEEVIIGNANKKSAAIKAMPAARALAKEMNIDLSTVVATGPQGLITVEDIKKVSHKKSLGGEVLKGVRRSMAHAMAQSHQEIVPVTIFEDANISHLNSSTDITVILLKAIATAAKAEPALNAWFEGTSLERKLFTEVNIGLAIDTPDGLFVPVIKNVETQDDQSLRNAVNQFKISVKDRSVPAKDMQGATITLSNFGMIAGRYATPIIVPPAVAILACGRSRETVFAKDGEIKIGRLLPLSLTFDHRAVTGGEATRFLGALLKFIEE